MPTLPDRFRLAITEVDDHAVDYNA
jgi:hypothetical protein